MQYIAYIMSSVCAKISSKERLYMWTFNMLGIPGTSGKVFSSKSWLILYNEGNTFFFCLCF